MAPRFDENMYNCWETADGADALVCFCFPCADIGSLDRLRRPFVERLIERVVGERQWVPSPGDINTEDLEELLVYFLKPEDVESAAKLEPPKWPLRWMWYLLSGGYGRMWQRLGKLAELSIRTSHEYSCAIAIESKVHSAEELAEHISEIARELRVVMPRNRGLPSLEAVMMSNKTFSLDGFTETPFAKLVRWIGLSR